MRYLSFDSVGGASGDMLLSALIDLGADLAPIAQTISQLLPGEVEFICEPFGESGLHGTRATVKLLQQPQASWIDSAKSSPSVATDGDCHHHDHDHDHDHDHHEHGVGAHHHEHEPHDHHHDGGHKHHHPHEHHDHHPEGHGEDHHHHHDEADHHHHEHAHGRGLREIRTILANPLLPERARQLALAAFQRLAEAEGHVHGVAPEEVHFHEVGAADAIADIVGSSLALLQLGVEGVRVGPLPAGVGTITCAHGEMPNPAPATLRLLEGFAIVQTSEPFELVTPTGAALLSAWSTLLPAPPAAGRVVGSGHGFGQRKLQGRPNLLRATLMESVASESVPNSDDEELCLLESNLDDCNPQWCGDLIERLLASGALDAWATPIVMKKGRPAIMLSALCRPQSSERLRRLIFEATTTFGIRATTLTRRALERRTESRTTPYGEVRVKIGTLEGREITATPEYEDCAARAKEHSVTSRQVFEAARYAR